VGTPRRGAEGRRGPPARCPSRGEGGAGQRGVRCLLLMPSLPLAQLYQQLHDKMEDYQQKVSVATRDLLFRRS